MANYAAGTKLSELTLAGEPSVAAGVPAKGAPFTRAAAAHAPSAAPALPTPAPAAPAPSERFTAVSPRPGPSQPEAKAQRPSHSKSPDRFFSKATAELEAGEIDQPLWVRAVARSGGDEAMAKPAYLRARATALRLVNRDHRADVPTRGVGESGSQSDATRHGGPAKLKKHMMLAAATIGALIVIAGVALVGWEATPARQPLLATAAAQAGAPKLAAPAAGAKPGASSAAGAARHEMSSDDFAGKIRELKDAGNWNVLVLYAVEWTRKQPTNPQAWKELSTGYATLHQFDEALEAATQAVQLAPADFELWQTLGQVNVELRQPAQALVAFERAADLNGRDVTSLIQAGALNAELGHLPQARDAFARALAVSPGDVDALCGAASIAQKEGRPKDAEALMRQVKSAERVCRDAAAAEPVAMAAASDSKKKATAASTRR
jgi:tetratricopeptide (TPR) repeat protein